MHESCRPVSWLIFDVRQRKARDVSPSMQSMKSRVSHSAFDVLSSFVRGTCIRRIVLASRPTPLGKFRSEIIAPVISEASSPFLSCLRIHRPEITQMRPRPSSKFKSPNKAPEPTSCSVTPRANLTGIRNESPVRNPNHCTSRARAGRGSSLTLGETCSLQLSATK